VSKGKEKVVFKSGPRPKWAFDQPMFFKKGFYYASGMFTDAPNLGKGLEIATKLAEAKLIESISMELESNFKYMSTGIAVDDSELKSIVKTATGIIVVKGMAHNKYYYEKKSAPSVLGVNYSYDCFALVELALDNYKKAVVEGVNRIIEDSVRAEGLVDDFENFTDSDNARTRLNEITLPDTSDQ
ncbi:MAG: hypothetical protein HQM16_17090, partial [Deltaproteobacteria bacterium]|nr:hypothetical protein [Deltaproteobacteria bacterium]